MDINTDDIGSFTPFAGNIIPSQIKTGHSKGPNIDSILREMDREDILREVSKHPVCERKALLKKLYAQKRRGYAD